MKKLTHFEQLIYNLVIKNTFMPEEYDCYPH